MPDVQEPWIAVAPAAFRETLHACALGAIPANIAAMRVLMDSHEPGEAERVLIALLKNLDGEHTQQTKHLKAVLELLRANPQAYDTVKTVLRDVRHDEAADNPNEDIRRLADAFDRAAQAHPEGSVALYALGNPDLLKAATAEIVERMREWGLLGMDRRVLDLGCGIGRFGEALAGEVGSVVGVDISGEMIAAARRRCAAFPNLNFVKSSGRDLGPFADSSFDLVLAVDTFPYLVQSGMCLVETHMAEAARVLRAGGDLLILNFSYRADPEQDRADIHRLSGAFGFDVLRDGIATFALWDGLAFHLVKAA